MIREVTFDDDLIRYWRDEQSSKSWYKESNETDDCTDESFQVFCDKHRIFEIDECALLYLEYETSKIIRLHFSILRRQRPKDLIADLIEIRNRLFAGGAEIIYGWVLRNNRPLKCICTQLGLMFNGVVSEMERENKKPLIRQQFAVHRHQFNVVRDARSLILSV